jgi:AraC-like DNA-binding protein
VTGFLLRIVDLARTGEMNRRPASLHHLLGYINHHVEEPLPLIKLAAKAGLSLPRFKERFKEKHGVPPGEYVLRARVAQAEKLLRETDRPITWIAHELGYSSSQYFATVMKRYTRQSPRALRRRPA